MNIHILSNSPTRINSGFGVVTRNLALGLKELGNNVSVSDMQNVYNKEMWNDIVIYPMNSVVNASTLGEFYFNELKQLTKNLKESKADVMLIVYSSYDDVIRSNRLHELFKNTMWLYPVEGENLPDIYTNELKKVKHIVPMTKQGKTELDKKNLSNIGNEIYHGFDEKIFKPLNISNGKDSNELHYCKWSHEKYQRIADGKWICKNGCYECNGENKTSCKFYQEEEIVLNLMGNEFTGNVCNLESLKDQFGVETVYGFIGDNNGKRKKIDRLLASYGSLCKSNPNTSTETMLILHTLPVSNNGMNLWDYIKKYDLEKKNVVFCYGTDDLGNSWSDKALNIFYNSMDVNVSTSSCEGFCLPSLESMACKKPNLAPRFSSFVELFSDSNNIKDNSNENNNESANIRGLLCDIEGYERMKNGIRRCLVSIKDTSNNLNIIHDDKNLRTDIGNRSYDWVKQYEWSNISKEFNDRFQEVFKI